MHQETVPNPVNQGQVLFDIGASLGLIALLFALRPAMVDGDGLSHSSHAIYAGFLEGMDPKHPTLAAVFRCVYLPLEWLGLRRCHPT